MYLYIDSTTPDSGLGGGKWYDVKSLRGAKQIASRIYQKDLKNLTIQIYTNCPINRNGRLLSERRNFPSGTWADTEMGKVEY